MKDTKIKSLVEALFNVVVGVLVGFVANMVILPMFGMPFSLINFGIIGVIYTFISLVRAYILRRLFVNGIYEWFINKRIR